jgi:hypothetical protein
MRFSGLSPISTTKTADSGQRSHRQREARHHLGALPQRTTGLAELGRGQPSPLARLAAVRSAEDELQAPLVRAQRA